MEVTKWLKPSDIAAGLGRGCSRYSGGRYLMAAEQDYARAQNNLGIMHEQSLGVTQDLVTAYM